MSDLSDTSSENSQPPERHDGGDAIQASGNATTNGHGESNGNGGGDITADSTAADIPPSQRHNQHFVEPKVTGINRLTRRGRKLTKSTLQPYPGWEQPPSNRRPYHEYVHDLAEAGWDMLKNLDSYMNVDLEDSELVISVIDIDEDAKTYVRHPDIYDEDVLSKFMEQEEKNRAHCKVRLYMAEQKGGLAAGVIEAFGSNLDLDPRFFQWSIHGNKHVLSPSHRHRAPYLSIGFGVPKLSTPSRTDAEKFKVTVYVKPDEVGDGWTGLLLFDTHTKVKYSPQNMAQPPNFSHRRPPKIPKVERSFRELYIETFSQLDLSVAIASPFYAISFLLRLNYICWSQVINSIRDEDRRIKGISDTTVGHAEEIAKSLSLVRRSGSLGWRGAHEPLAAETRDALEEDFTHLVDQTKYLWEEREKMGEIKKRKSEARWTLLTNTFTYVFAPITIISGIYGMNVYEINGSAPDIWQFFVGVVALNVVVVLCLMLANWIHILQKHQRKAGWKEILGFATGLIHHANKD